MKRNLMIVILLLFSLLAGCAGAEKKNGFNSLPLEEIRAAADQYAVSKTQGTEASAPAATDPATQVAEAEKTAEEEFYSPSAEEMEKEVDVESIPEEIVETESTGVVFENPSNQIGVTSQIRILKSFANFQGLRVAVVKFEFGKAEVSEKYYSVLNDVASKKIIALLGHGSILGGGGKKYSLERAEIVAEILKKKGADLSKTEVAGRGATSDYGKNPDDNQIVVIAYLE